MFTCQSCHVYLFFCRWKNKKGRKGVYHERVHAVKVGLCFLLERFPGLLQPTYGGAKKKHSKPNFSYYWHLVCVRARVRVDVVYARECECQRWSRCVCVSVIAVIIDHQELAWLRVGASTYVVYFPCVCVTAAYDNITNASEKAGCLLCQRVCHFSFAFFFQSSLTYSNLQAPPSVRWNCPSRAARVQATPSWWAVVHAAAPQFARRSRLWPIDSPVKKRNR